MTSRILIIPEYPPYGGTLSLLLKLLDYHQRNNIKTAVLISPEMAYPHVLEAFAARDAKVYRGPQRTDRYRKLYKSLLFDVWFTWKAFWSFRPNLIAVSEGTFTQMYGVLLFPVPVVFTIHSLTPKKPWKRGIRALVRLICRVKKTVFLTTSQCAADHIQAFLAVPSSCSKVIYNTYRAPSNDIQPQAKQRMILSIGHMIHYKNPQGWLEVARRVIAERPDVRFTWLGDGDLLDSIRQQVAELGLSESIDPVGYTAKVDQYYEQAMIYFHPSFTENHCISIIDAMARGLPCIVSDVGGNPESVIDGETGFCCAPDDVEGFARHLITLLDNSELREQLGHAGQQRANEMFSETMIEAQTIALYQRLLGRESRLNVTE